MLYVSDTYQAYVVETFNSTSRYLDDLWESVIVLRFVVRCFVSVLVLQSS